MLALPLLAMAIGAIGEELRISSVGDFLTFVDDVNGGNKYRGTTVLLESDIDLSGKTLDPIGNTNKVYFLGTFDGQGYSISNVAMTSSTRFSGLFGFSMGSTIKNVIVDDSCSFTSSFSTEGNHGYIGGLFGYCIATNESCTIKNSINMGKVSFTGETGKYNYIVIGGLGGFFGSTKYYEAYIKNSANYGSVTHSGYSGYSNIGGIAGSTSGVGQSMTYIQNVLSYGSVAHSGTTVSRTTLRMGGFIGDSSYTALDNCVSYGDLTANRESSYVASIVGYPGTSTLPTNCYCRKDISYDPYGALSSITKLEYITFNKNTFTMTELVNIGSYSGNGLLGALNALADYNPLFGYSNWASNKNEYVVSFTVDGKKRFTLAHKIFVLPNLANQGNVVFKGWYTDSNCSQLWVYSSVSSSTDLYGKFEEDKNMYVISFNTRGGEYAEPISAPLNSVVALPRNLTKEGNCTIGFWENEINERVQWNFTVTLSTTLYAVWRCTEITSLYDFADFSKVANSGVNYNGTTVVLRNDIDFSGIRIKPIGNFIGTFDGQGHVISYYKAKTTSLSTGLFGYSEGTTIKNLVLDDTCSVESSYSSDSGYSGVIAGVIQSCSAYEQDCIIENIVNMGSITFKGKMGLIYIGGIAGSLSYSSSLKHEIFVRNCANYGSLSHTGDSNTPNIGGIVATSSGYPQWEVHIHNCLNYGAIYIKEKVTGYVYLGGIIGNSDYVDVENCFSYGNITVTTSSSYAHIGSIAGGYYSSSYINITNCFWTSEAGSTVSGSVVSMDNVSSQAELDSELVDKLNAHAASKSWNEWLLNLNSVPVKYDVKKGSGFTISAKVMILLKLSSNENRAFSGWYSDEARTTLFTATEIDSDTTLYGVWTANITFNLGNGTVLTETFICNDYIVFPDVSKEGFIFEGWFLDKECTIPFKDEIASKHVVLYPGFKNIKSFAMGISPLAAFALTLLIL